jgi:hypothetical protein
MLYPEALEMKLNSCEVYTMDADNFSNQVKAVRAALNLR